MNHICGTHQPRRAEYSHRRSPSVSLSPKHLICSAFLAALVQPLFAKEDHICTLQCFPASLCFLSKCLAFSSGLASHASQFPYRSNSKHSVSNKAQHFSSHWFSSFWKVHHHPPWCIERVHGFAAAATETWYSLNSSSHPIKLLWSAVYASSYLFLCQTGLHAVTSDCLEMKLLKNKLASSSCAKSLACEEVEACHHWLNGVKL